MYLWLGLVKVYLAPLPTNNLPRGSNIIPGTFGGGNNMGDTGDGGSDDTPCQHFTRFWSTLAGGLPPSLLSPLLFLVNRMCTYFPLVHNESWPFDRLYTWLNRDHNVTGGGFCASFEPHDCTVSSHSCASVSSSTLYASQKLNCM